MKKLQVEGWKVEKLGDVLQKTETVNPTLKPNHDFLYVDVSSVNNQTYSIEDVTQLKGKDAPSRARKLIKTGDVIFATVRPTLKRIAIVPEEYDNQVCSTGYFVLRPRDFISNKYLFYFLLSDEFMEKMEKLQKGASYPAVTDNEVKSQMIAYPPLPEQQRIVSLLDETFAGLAQVHANAERNLVNAREVFEAALQNVFENKDGNWEEKTLQEVVDENCTLSYGIVQPGEEYPNGIPVIRPTDLTKKVITLDGLKRIDPRLANSYKRTTLTGDELLLCVRGSTGTVSVTSEELKGANVTRGIVPIRFSSEFINQEFGYYLLISGYVQKQIKEKTYGAALMQINIGDLREILTPFPPLEEQRAIVQRLDALAAETSRLEAVYQSKLEAVEELRKSVLGKAFEGEL